MRSLKESVGISIARGDTSDRIAALARAGKLGIIMWHWKYGGQDRALEACNLLTRRAAKRLKIRGYERDYERLRSLCKQVLMEWFNPECKVCQGVREVSGEHKRIVCEACKGTGVHRYSDYERADAVGISQSEYKNKWDKFFHIVHTMSAAMDSETYLIVREQLHEDEAHVFSS